VQVYAANGERVDQFYLERRVWVPIAELPPHVWQAFVASEDRRFFEHEGVDPLGILRALVVNLRGGETRQGGSTITQQLVKNLLVGKERSYRRKLREAVLAWRLDAELDKMALLELYVNYIALGSGNYGVEAAAQDYFGISARDLDAGQAALLAGLVPAPSRYSPRSDARLAASSCSGSWSPRGSWTPARRANTSPTPCWFRASRRTAGRRARPT
jgi:penicillin-binding protein 1A